MAPSCYSTAPTGHICECGKSLTFSYQSLRRACLFAVWMALFGSGRGVLTRGEANVAMQWKNFWSDESGQDVAEYAVMLAVILVIVVGTIRLIGSNANNVFSQVGSALNQ